MAKKKPPFLKRIFNSINIIVILMLVLYTRLVFLAVSPEIDGIDMSDFAKQRNTANIILPAKRGTIYDKNGLNLASNVSSYTVIAFLDSSRTINTSRPMHVVDKMKTAEKLAPLINMSEETIFNLLSRDGYQVELGPGGRDISELKKREIEALNLPGISFMPQPKRNYPNGDFASYIIGYAKRHENIINDKGIRRIHYEIIGELGIEGMYNNILNGVDGELIYQRDRFGHKIPDTNEMRIDEIDGQDIYLTIDSSIQRFLEAAVKDVNETYSPEWIQISVMEAKTGKLLGSATTPSYNPNILNITNYENPLVSFLFEPGSTMKTFTYMCALENGIYDDAKKFESGRVEIHDRVISDWNRDGWGIINYDEGYKYSSNVSAFTLVRDLKAHELEECFRKYGFGAQTNIELPRESNGTIPFRNEVEKANAAFGQGLTTTAIQHLQGLSIIANDGYLVKPYVVDKIFDPNTSEYTFVNKSEKEKVVEKETTDKLKKLMYSVVNETGGTGAAYRANRFEVIGKTGTAQIFNTKTGSYMSGGSNYIYSFGGMFPAENPEIIIYAAMERPAHSANLGMARATKEVIDNIGKYLAIGFDKAETENVISLQIENYINKNLVDVKENLLKNGINPIIIGSGEKVINQRPMPGTRIFPSERLILLTEEPEIKIPNFKNWSRKDVLYFKELTGIEMQISGYGYVVSQNIEPDSILTSEYELEIVLKSRNVFEEKEEEPEE